jgi:hypothetical protein
MKRVIRRDRQSLSQTWPRMGYLVHVAHEGVIAARAGESKEVAGESRAVGMIGTPTDAQRKGAFADPLPVRSPVSHLITTPCAPARSGSFALPLNQEPHHV